ncbi:MAG: hypothetical protein Q7R96_00940 [Nanoarchaeota archaeon]|nr:hypothetical protein [Nanoarchaeota archaeon]
MHLQTRIIRTPTEQTVCTPASLRGHIVNAHLEPMSLLCIGIPRYDIEAALVRQMDLAWVVKKAEERLEPPTTARLVTLLGTAGVEKYQKLVVKTIRYIEQLYLGQADWPRIIRAFPEAEHVFVDITHDSGDDSYFTIHQL